MERDGAVVAGLITLDIIPLLPRVSLPDALAPGLSVEVGAVGMYTGGAVANTGRCLHRLGIRTHLVGKVGDDAVGEVILRLIREDDPRLTDHMIVTPSENSPCTIVLSPPGTDRSFITYPGTSHTFGAGDVPYDLLHQVRLFHFGYPPYMRQMYGEDGLELATMYRQARETGTITALDMAYPDAQGPGGQVNWRSVMEHTLPYVDVFLPSLDEMLFMLHRLPPTSSPDSIVSESAAELLAMGTRIVVLKLGDRGLYLRTGSQSLPDLPAGWENRELWVPCFQPDCLAGTNGAGDATIAGFLAAILYGLPAETALTSAVAVGACNVEATDALGGIRSWEETQARINRGWARSSLRIEAPGWRWDNAVQCWIGPQDGA
jgi:sugar/nucleoside kinase (ribokinase family)